MQTKSSATAVAGLALGALMVSIMMVPLAQARAAAPTYKDIYTTRLTGAQETPAVMTDTTAYMMLKVRDDEGAMRYRLSLRNGEDITDAHLHCGAIGEDGPAVVDLFTPTKAADIRAGSLSGTITADDIMANLQDCDPGIQTVAHLAQAMREGKIYVNVHSVEYPDGLIRGQLTERTSDMFMPPADDTATNSDTSQTDDSSARMTDSAGPNGAHILLSNYYVLPPDNFTITGHRFAAGEVVRVNAMGNTYTATADNQGSFTMPALDVPLTDAGSAFDIEATGMTSGITETAHLNIGTYYPVVTPSSWYMDGGEEVTFQGRHFGPNEDVQIMLGDTVLGTVSSNALGALEETLSAPNVAGSHIFTFKGMDSGTTYRLSVNVAQE